MVAVTQIVEQDAVVAPPKSARASRLPGAAWSNPTQVWRSLPMTRLVAEIWSVPQVNKIEVHADGAGIQVHVVVVGDNREAGARIFEAERAYLNSTKLHSFDLHITDAKRVPPHILEGYASAGFQTVLER